MPAMGRARRRCRRPWWRSPRPPRSGCWWPAAGRPRRWPAARRWARGPGPGCSAGPGRRVSQVSLRPSAASTQVHVASDDGLDVELEEGSRAERLGDPSAAARVTVRSCSRSPGRRRQQRGATSCSTCGSSACRELAATVPQRPAGKPRLRPSSVDAKARHQRHQAGHGRRVGPAAEADHEPARAALAQVVEQAQRHRPGELLLLDARVLCLPRLAELRRRRRSGSSRGAQTRTPTGTSPSASRLRLKAAACGRAMRVPRRRPPPSVSVSRPKRSGGPGDQHPPAEAISAPPS